MLLRRAIHQLKHQNWSTLALEFILVVLGIFAALQANNWNEARKDKQDEQLFLAQLHSDVELVEQLSERVRIRRLNRLQTIAEASDVIFARVERDVLSDQECAAVGSSHYLNINIADLPSVAELISTGRMSIIQNPEMRTALVQLQQIKASFVSLISIQSIGVIPLPSRYADLIQLEARHDVVGGEANAYYQCNLGKMRLSQNFLNDFSSNQDRYDAYIRDGLGPWSTQLDRVHHMVDESLRIDHN